MKIILNKDTSYKIKVTLLVLSLVHIIIFSLRYTSKKEQIRGQIREEAVTTNDLVALLKDRNDSDIDVLFSDTYNLTSFHDFLALPQYTSIYTDSWYDLEEPNFISSNPMEKKDILEVSNKLYSKWIVRKLDYNKNLYIYINGIAYLGRPYKDSNKDPSILIIQLKEPHFSRLFNSSKLKYKRNFYVFDRDNEIITSSSSSLTPPVNNLIKENNYSERLISKDLYIVTYNGITQWKTLVVYKDIYKGLILSIFISSLFISLPIGSIFFIFLDIFSKNFYEGLKSIVETLELHMDGDANDNLKKLLNMKKDYESTLPKFKEKFLIDILSSREAISNEGSITYDFSFNSNTYFLITILPKDILLDDHFEKLVIKWNNQIDTTSNNNLIAIFSSDNKDELRELPKFFTSLIDSEVVALSSIYSDKAYLNKAYQEAIFCYNSSLRASSNIVLPNMLKEINQDIPDTSTRELIKNIKLSKDWEAALRSLLQEIFSSNISVMSIKVILTRLLSDISSIEERGVSREYIEEVYFELNTLDTQKKVEVFFLTVIESIVRAVDERNQVNDAQVIKLIEDYIEKNCHKISFTISLLAEELGYSVSYLERKFKNIKETSIKSYLIRVRLDLAKKHILNDPKLRIKELAWMVGYENSRSFINIFKKYEGITPGEYKKKLGAN